jgi:hypothetical protein
MVHATPDQGEVHFRIKIGKARHIWMCGNGKESLKHTLFYLDENVTLPEFKYDLFQPDTDTFPDYVIPYTPSANRKLWTRKKYVNFECKMVMDLPPGEHVLSISPNSSHPKHISQVSHVIMWP